MKPRLYLCSDRSYAGRSCSS